MPIGRKKKKSKGKDSKYFTTTSKGEISEWKNELYSKKKSTIVAAVKKVIAAMTVGKDVSMLFPDVINCMQTDNVELKKLVYLYLINYAKTHPTMAIMAVNTFVKDTTHRSPLIRALSVRTMGCIRVEKITEYLTKPLQRALADEDPYVKKTAAMCVAKLYDINATLVVEQGFLDKLKELISDANPMVVANAVAAITEIEDASGSAVLAVTSTVLTKLLAALNECSEWGQVFILDFLAKYQPSEEREAENIVDRVVPRLAHSNSAVVLSAVKIVMRYLDIIKNSDTVARFCRKLSPPLVTLCQSSQHEIQYVALRNVNLVVQKRPSLLARRIKVFFCKYNDPIYVKMEKLEILVRLTSESNITHVLAELREYAAEVDVDFVRKSVRTIGRLAIKLERRAEKCVQELMKLIQTKVNYVVQEAVIVIKDVFRKYPNRYEGVIGALCDALGTLDEPEAKASMVWIIGEYASRIANAKELLEMFLETFHDEPPLVQLQLLTATVKLFLRRPDSGQELVTHVLGMATEQSDNPDLRDRGYVYWRLLASAPSVAKAVVLAERPLISDDTNALDPSLLDVLIANISSLAAVYHKPPETFVTRSKIAVPTDDYDSDDSGSDSDSDTGTGSGAGAGAGGGAGGGAGAGAGAGGDTNGSAPAGALDDLFAAAPEPAAAAPAPAPAAGALDDLFSAPEPTKPAGAGAAGPAAAPVLGTAGDVTVRGKIARTGGQTVLQLSLEGASVAAATMIKIKIYPNTFGVTAPEDTNSTPATVPLAGGAANVTCVCKPTNVASGGNPFELKAMLVTNTGAQVELPTVHLPFEALFGEDGLLPQADYIGRYKTYTEANTVRGTIDNAVTADIASSMAALNQRLKDNNIFFVAQRKNASNQLVVFYSLKVVTGQIALVELTFSQGAVSVGAVVKSENAAFSSMVAKCLTGLVPIPAPAAAPAPAVVSAGGIDLLF